MSIYYRYLLLTDILSNIQFYFPITLNIDRFNEMIGKFMKNLHLITLRKSCVIIVGLFIFSTLSCSSIDKSEDGSEKKDDAIEFEAFDWTILADKKTLDSISVIENGYIEFEGSPDQVREIPVPAINNLEATVLVLGVTKASPDGMVAVITRTENVEEKLRLHYVEASPVVAFRSMKIHANRTLRQEDSVEGKSLSGGFDFVEIEDLQLSGSMKSDHVVDIMLAWDWGEDVETEKITSAAARCALKLGCDELNEGLPAIDASTKFKSSISTTLSLTGSAAINLVDFSRDLAKLKLKPILVGPIVLVPEINATLALNGQLGVGFEASATMNSTMSSEVIVVGNKLQQSSSPELSQSSEFIADLDAGANALPQGSLEVSLMGTLHLRAFKILGPYVSLGPGAKSEFDLGNTPCGNNSIGANYVLGFSADTNFDGEDELDYSIDGQFPATEESYDCG